MTDNSFKRHGNELVKRFGNPVNYSLDLNTAILNMHNICFNNLQQGSVC